MKTINKLTTFIAGKVFNFYFTLLLLILSVKFYIM